jgi:hypothetical protein
MNQEMFIVKINEILKKYDASIEENCDLWSMMDGYCFYKQNDNVPFANVRGVCYAREGDRLVGDFSGFVLLVEYIFKSEYGY